MYSIKMPIIEKKAKKKNKRNIQLRLEKEQNKPKQSRREVSKITTERKINKDKKLALRKDY